MNKKLLIPIIIAVGLVAWLVSLLAKNHSEDVILVSGTIEATEVHLSFQAGGKIKEIYKEEGTTAKPGEILARLDKEEFLKIKNQAELLLQEAKFNRERLSQDYNRVEGLFQSGAVSAQQKDTLKTNLEVAKLKEQSLQSGLDLAVLKLGYTDLVSPIGGMVTVKSAEAGEIVQAGAAILTVANLTNIWVTGYIKEPDLGRVKLNQKAQVKTDSYPGKDYPGYVSFIASESEFTPKQIQTAEERVNRVYRIKISLDNTGQVFKTGMPVDAYLLPNQP
ncbi:MAG: efflux RND transporter periplasmic adaptor subunit [Planctomycetota bacterium]